MAEEIMEQIIFTDENGEDIPFYVLEQTTINGIHYILVADSEAEEANALILKEALGTSNEEEIVYDIVEEQVELQAISKIFIEMLEDVEIEVENE